METSITQSQWFKAAADDDCVVLQTNLNDFQGTLTEQGETALMIATRAGNLAAAHILAEAESRKRMPNGYTALMLAASLNFAEISRLLVPLEADVVTDTGMNALMVAANKGSVDSLRLLLDYIGNDVDNEDNTALFYVTSGGNMQCANILVQAFPPSEKELVRCIDMATAQGNTEMLNFLTAIMEELVGSNNMANVIMECRSAAALERSTSKGIESAAVEAALYEETGTIEHYGSTSASSEEHNPGAIDSLCPYSKYTSGPENDTTCELDSKNDLVVSDTSIDLRTFRMSENPAYNRQGNAMIFTSSSPVRRELSKKDDETVPLKEQLQIAKNEIARLQVLLKDKAQCAWEDKFLQHADSNTIATLTGSEIRRIQDECSSLELKVCSLELKNKQLRTTLDDIEQQRQGRIFNEAEFTAERILEYLSNNKGDAETVYNELRQILSVPDSCSIEMPVSVIPMDPDGNSQDDGHEVSDKKKSHSSSIEMIEMWSPTPGHNPVPGLEERLEHENLALQAEIDNLNKQVSMKDEQIKTLRQELYELRQAQLKMSMTMGPSMELTKTSAGANRFDLSETNHEIEVDMTISNTSFSFPESHYGVRGDSTASIHPTSEGQEPAVPFTGLHSYDQEHPVRLPPLPNTRSSDFPEINASVVQITLGKMQLELQEALDDKRVILEKLEEERQEKSHLTSELTICRSTIDHMTSEIGELRDRLDESLAKESILSNDLQELRGRFTTPPAQGDYTVSGLELRRDSTSPLSVLGFNDQNVQSSPTLDNIYDIIRTSNSYKELLLKLRFNITEIDTILSHQAMASDDQIDRSSFNEGVDYNPHMANQNRGAIDPPLSNLQEENDELTKRCAELQSSNVVLSAEANKLVSEVLELRQQLKEQEQRYMQLLNAKSDVSLQKSADMRHVQDSLYDLQPIQGDVASNAVPYIKTSQNLNLESTRNAAGVSDSQVYSYNNSSENRPSSYSGSMTDERCRRISNYNRRRSSQQNETTPFIRRNPFDMRENASKADNDSYLVSNHDEHDRRINIQDLEPFSSIMSTSAGTGNYLSLNLVDGIYTNVTPLMKAVLENNMQDIENNLMYVRKTRSDGVTALMLAAYLNRVEIAEKLGPLEANIRGPDNLTALEIALYKENHGVATVLREFEGIDVTHLVKITARRHTNLMTAASNNDPLAVWCLIPFQARVQDYSGKTALMHAIEQNRIFCARILATVEARIQDKNGFTALMYAAQAGNDEIVNLLVDQEAGFIGRWHEFLPSKFTALMLACYYGRIKAVMTLLPVEGNLKDSVGRTAKYYSQNCNPRVPLQIKATLIDLFNEYRHK